MISVIDYGMGNLRSVVKAIEKYTNDVQIIKSPEKINKSKALVMPGDGAFGQAMENLKKEGFIEPILEYIAKGGYFFGICLGYQLLFTSSEEFGYYEGLNVIKGMVVKFKNGLKVPHMGWNQVNFVKNNIFMNGIPQNSYFYFIHTFHASDVDDEWIIGQTDYGDVFPSIVGKDNVIATQFHPEKSHKYGLKIIENFVRQVC